MVEMTYDRKVLPTNLRRFIKTEQVKVHATYGEIKFLPIEEDSIDYIEMLHGSLADYPELSVDKYLERKRADKELER